MAERRMFAKTIIDSDAFLEMPQTSQLLYFHLSMRGDDDGFINKPRTIMKMVGSKDDDFRILVERKFIIPFETGVVVIKHWKIHNYIRNDRYSQTKYLEEKSRLAFDENNAYQLTDGIPVVDQWETQVRLGKDSIDKDNINNVQSNDSTKPISKKDIEELFEKVWKTYPYKKGKGQISDAKKKVLFEIGEEELTRAIERYDKELEKDKDWRKPQNGSTFFNSGYVDYLDANYVPGVNQSNTAKASPNNKFNNFGNQRDYSESDYNSLEQKLLEKSKGIHK